MDEIDDDPVVDPSVTCEGCGQCCMHMRSPPSIVFWENNVPVLVASNGIKSDPDDYAWLMAAPAEARQIKLERVNSDAPDDCPCCWLEIETKRCRFYDFRPGVCRDFNIGGTSCLEYRKLLAIE